MREALAQEQRGWMHILERMEGVLPEARSKVSTYAPRFYTLQIPVDKIRDLIGPGGKMIRSIIEQTGVKIDVEDSGKVNVASNDQASAAKALQIIGDLTATAEVGKTYLGKVTRLADFGAFVEIIPGTDGLLHISEVAEHRIKDVRDELKEGDQVLVKVLAVEGNRIRLSRKAILKEQRAKMGGAAPAAPTDGETESEAQTVPAGAPGLTLEGGAEFEEGKCECVHVGGMTIGRASYEPGWKWSVHVGAAAGTKSCQVEHVGLVVSGRATAAMDDGRIIEMKPGDLFYIAPGHDSWVLGDEPYVSPALLRSRRVRET